MKCCIACQVKKRPIWRARSAFTLKCNVEKDVSERNCAPCVNTAGLYVICICRALFNQTIQTEWTSNLSAVSFIAAGLRLHAPIPSMSFKLENRTRIKFVSCICGPHCTFNVCGFKVCGYLKSCINKCLSFFSHHRRLTGYAWNRC